MFVSNTDNMLIWQFRASFSGGWHRQTRSSGHYMYRQD